MIPIRSLPKACGAARLRARRAAPTALATIRCSIFPSSARPRRSWIRRPRTASAIVARRSPGCSRSSNMQISLERPTQVRLAVLPPLALYVHIPWCVRKCPYCDFNSHEARSDVPETPYVDALLKDLEGMLPLVWGRKVVSIFIGGGTPSLFSADSIDRLLGGIRARLPIVPGAEITLEANPGTFERHKFAGFFAAGVNRLSLGVQSFD